MHAGLGEFLHKVSGAAGLSKKIERASFFTGYFARHLFRFWFPTRAFRFLELKGNPVQYRSCPRNCKFEFRCTAVKQLSEEKQVEAYRGCISFGVKLFFISIFSSQAGFD
jgi:hypothetical protein